MTLPEIYIHFVHNIISVFHKLIKTVESDNLLITKVFDIFQNLKSDIIYRKEKNFFGYKVNQALKNLNTYDKKSFEKDAIEVYDRILSYLEKWFNHDENSIYSLCKILNLDKEFDVDQAVCLANCLKITVDGDELFNEISCLNRTVFASTSTNHSQNTETKWITFFANVDAPNLLKICQHVFAIPPNNCYVERIFSVMENIWSDERNRLQNNMVKSELMLHFNMKMSCPDFAAHLTENNTEIKSLIEAASSCKKYKFKINSS